MNKKPNSIHTLPEMIKINSFLFKKHLANIKYNSSWIFLALLTWHVVSSDIQSTIRFKNLVVTYTISCIIKNRYATIRFISKIKLKIQS